MPNPTLPASTDTTARIQALERKYEHGPGLDLGELDELMTLARSVGARDER